LKLQEVVRGVRPLALPEMANLFNSFHVTICPGLVSSCLRSQTFIPHAHMYTSNLTCIVFCRRIQTLII
jgi:AP-2 complex subunit alpha